MTTSLQEALSNIVSGAAEIIQGARKGMVNKLESWSIAREINKKQQRLAHIENTLLPVTKKSVSRKKLLQEHKRLQASIQELQGDYHRLRNQQKRDKSIDPDEIDTAFMNLKGWHREKK